MIRIFCFVFLGLSPIFLQGQNICESTSPHLKDVNVINKCIDTTSSNKERVIIRSTFSTRSLASHRVLKRSYKVRENSTKKITSNIFLKPKKAISFKPDFQRIGKVLENINPHYYEERVYDFNTVDKLPVFKKCKKISQEEEFDCFNSEMMNHLTSNFQYPKKALVNNVEGDVEVSFYIDTNGDVRNIVTKAADNTNVLKKEVKRIISSLPKFDAAKKSGQNVIVKYSLVVSFTL